MTSKKAYGSTVMAISAAHRQRSWKAAQREKGRGMWGRASQQGLAPPHRPGRLYVPRRAWNRAGLRFPVRQHGSNPSRRGLPCPTNTTTRARARGTPFGGLGIPALSRPADIAKWCAELHVARFRNCRLRKFPCDSAECPELVQAERCQDES